MKIEISVRIESILQGTQFCVSVILATLRKQEQEAHWRPVWPTLGKQETKQNKTRQDKTKQNTGREKL